MSHRFRQRARPQFWRIAAAVFLVSLVPAAGAQSGGVAILGDSRSNQPPNTDIENVTEAYHQGASLLVTVLGENKTKLDRQAVVRMHCDNPLGTTYQTTKSGSQTTFLGLSVGKYSLQVSAAGYLSGYKEVQVSGVTDTLQVTVTIQKDPAAINLDATGTSDALMSSKASKDTAAAVAALKSSNLKDAKTHLDAAYRSVPESGRVNFLMGYLFFEQKDYDQATTYLNHAITLN